MLCDESASIGCARVMRGIESIENAVTRRSASARTRSPLTSGWRNAIRICPSPSLPTSSSERLLHLRNDVDAGERVAHELRAGLLVRGVEEPGFRPRSRLDQDLDARFRETLGRIGHEGHSPLAEAVSLGTPTFMPREV